MSNSPEVLASFESPENPESPGNPETAEITVRADMAFASSCRRLARAMAERARLPESGIRRVLLAVDEAYENIVKHAYGAAQSCDITLRITLERDALTLSFRDQGAPFDDALAPDAVGCGLALIKTLADEAQWTNLGHKGKELRLTFNPPSAPHTPAAPEAKERGSATSEQLYEIQRFRPEHALGVARTFYDVYGYSYPTESVYQPQRLIELNKSGALISAVAIAKATGEVVGHFAVLPYYPGGAAEASQGAVRPAHQGYALLRRMINYLDTVLVQNGVRRLVTHEVASHPASQIVLQRLGYKNCCLALGAMPATLEYKESVGRISQRESCVVSMKFLTPQPPVTITAPAHHQDMIERIYEHLGRDVAFAHRPSPNAPGDVAARVNSSWGCGDIQVRRVGADTPAEIKRCLRDLQNIGGAAVTFLELPLDQGGVDDVCLAAEAEGFFFAGLGPNTVQGGESFFLQHAPPEFDMSRVQIAAPMGKEIFAYVAQERARVNAPTSGGAGAAGV